MNEGGETHPTHFVTFERSGWVMSTTDEIMFIRDCHVPVPANKRAGRQALLPSLPHNSSSHCRLRIIVRLHWSTGSFPIEEIDRRSIGVFTKRILVEI